MGILLWFDCGLFNHSDVLGADHDYLPADCFGGHPICDLVGEVTFVAVLYRDIESVQHGISCARNHQNKFCARHGIYDCLCHCRVTLLVAFGY